MIVTTQESIRNMSQSIGYGIQSVYHTDMHNSPAICYASKQEAAAAGFVGLHNHVMAIIYIAACPCLI
jgi:hypothetical protein